MRQNVTASMNLDAQLKIFDIRIVMKAHTKTSHRERRKKNPTKTNTYGLVFSFWHRDVFEFVDFAAGFGDVLDVDERPGVNVVELRIDFEPRPVRLRMMNEIP
jgi:hypothetical protein